MPDSSGSGLLSALGGPVGAAASIGGGLLGLLGNIFAGAKAKKAANEYANQLMNVQMQMPEAVGQAQGLYERLAGQNMPGYQQMLTGIQSNIAGGLTQAEQASASPTGLLNTLAQLTTQGQQSANQLGIQNANYRTQQLQNLARFLGTTKAGYENQINQFNVDKQISAMKERMLGEKSLLQGITGGIGAMFSNFGAGQQMAQQQGIAGAMENYFGGGAGAGAGGGLLSSMLGNAGLNAATSVGMGFALP